MPPLPSAHLLHVGTYRRTMPVTLERMFENALDWKHLPWLHSSSFSAIECTEAGPWGWRANVIAAPEGGGGEFSMELLLDTNLGRWISRILSGSGAGNEIWTDARNVDADHIEVVVDFYVPRETDAETAQGLGQILSFVYQRLYDEDESMMVERQKQLVQLKQTQNGRAEEVELGLEADVRRNLPLTVDFFGAKVRIVDLGGRLVAHGVVCPHMLGPLGEATVENGSVRCPWHGYAFDLRTGRPTNGAVCRLAPIANVYVDEETRAVSLKRSGRGAAI